MGRDDMSEARKQLEQTLRKFTVYMFNLILITQARKKSSYFRVFCTISVAEKIWKKNLKRYGYSHCGMMETRAEVAVLRTYLEKQAILEPILFIVHQNVNKPKRGSEGCLWTHIFTFLCDYQGFFLFFLPKCKYNSIKLCYNRLQFVKEIQ